MPWRSRPPTTRISANRERERTGDQSPPAPYPLPPRGRRKDGGATMHDTQADVPSARRLRAQLAFKDSMVHGILQFTPSIAFRYVLHRCESRDIRCRESFRMQMASGATPGDRLRSRAAGVLPCFVSVPWRLRRRGFVVGRGLGRRPRPPPPQRFVPTCPRVALFVWHRQ